MEVILVNNDISKNKLTLLIQEADAAFVNSLRRSIISRVPTLAIEDIEFKNNSSALFDEVLAHRIGLVPLKTDLASYNFRDKCSCNGAGCSLCEVTFTMKEKGPQTVKASQMVSSDPAVVPSIGDLPLVKLLDNQELEFTAKAILGTGKEHAKWSPGLVFYRNKPIINIKNEKCEDASEILNICPQGVFELKNKKLSVNPDKIMDCRLCGHCSEVSNCVDFSIKENEFIFVVESWGQLSTFEMIEEGAKILLDIADDFERSIKV